MNVSAPTRVLITCLWKAPRCIDVEAFSARKSLSKVDYFVNGRRVGQEAGTPYPFTTTLLPGDSLI